MEERADLDMGNFNGSREDSNVSRYVWGAQRARELARQVSPYSAQAARIGENTCLVVFSLPN
jgi:hypothetical protein